MTELHHCYIADALVIWAPKSMQVVTQERGAENSSQKLMREHPWMRREAWSMQGLGDAPEGR